MTRSTRDSDSIEGAHGTGPQSREEAAAHYREYAAQMRELAAGEPDITLRNRLTAIADEYEALARRLESNPRR